MKKKTFDEVMEEPTYVIYANMIDDGNRHEISDGELELMNSSPTFIHQKVNIGS